MLIGVGEIGLDYGCNAKAVIMTQGLTEMRK
jgi:glycerol-3-phosphate dehydrogenase